MVTTSRRVTPTPSPTPAPSPSSVTVGGVTLPTAPSGGGSTADLYGLNSAAQSYMFDTTGLGGIFGGGNVQQMSGQDLIDEFLALGNAPNQGTTPDDAHQVIAAIQTALLYAGSYYPKNFTPTPGIVTTEDVKAFGQALQNLYNLNQAGGAPGANGKTTGMNITQFLSSQSALGMNGGPLAAGSAASAANPVVTANIRAPNSADVAATYLKVAQQIEGHRPSAAEVQAFVQTYTNQYVATEKQNALATYNAQVQKAQARISSGTQGNMNTPAAPPAPTSDQGTFAQGEINSINNPNAGQPLPHGLAVSQGSDSQYIHGSGGATPDLTNQMQTLQDIINQRSQQATGSGGSGSGGTPPGLIMAGTQQAETPDVAAANFARNTNPNAAAATDLNSTFQDFLQIIGSKLPGT